MTSEAAEVAEDYRIALEDLNTNMRFEISNLTVIARENTEHALVIAEALEKHILKTAPNKKLPALYLLDSIVKNVGTPYTLYLGRNIFKIFMEAYTVVDTGTRRRMEEMLKTWKQPVPGSMDTRPVFSHDLVRPIENALMKAKAAMMPQGQLPARTRSAVPAFRETPTPPGMRSATGTPGNMTAQPWPQPDGGQPGPGPMTYPSQLSPQAYQSSNSTPQPTISTPSFYLPMPGGYGSQNGTPQPAGNHIATLNSDIENLIVAMRADFSQNPHDSSVQTRLRALLDLQRIVQSTSLPPDQLQLIKNQVTELAAVTLRAPVVQTSTYTPVPQPAPVSVAPSAAVAPAPAPVTLDALLGSGAMAALMARTSSQNSTPQPPFSNAAIRSPLPVHIEPHRPAPTQTGNPLSLVDQLRAAGLLPSTMPTNTGNVASPPPTIPFNIASLLSQKVAPTWPSLAQPVHSTLNSLSLKQTYRPDIMNQLHDGLGIPCSQCGRRFKSDEEGRKKKTAHMDWHFRVHQRSTDAEKRGTHRSWFVDAVDWLKSREAPDSDMASASEQSVARATAAAAEASKPKYIPVPEPGSGVNAVCPICQDRFENKWLDTAQEWVWLDAVLVGGRAYHASCHREAMGDREGTPGPGPVLGKRKAEGSWESPKTRLLKMST